MMPFMQGAGALANRPLMPRSLAVDVVERQGDYLVSVDAPGAQLCCSALLLRWQER